MSTIHDLRPAPDTPCLACRQPIGDRPYVWASRHPYPGTLAMLHPMHSLHCPDPPADDEAEQ